MIIVYNEFELTDINLWKFVTSEKKKKKCMDIYTKNASLILTSTVHSSCNNAHVYNYKFRNIASFFNKVQCVSKANDDSPKLI